MQEQSPAMELCTDALKVMRPGPSHRTWSSEAVTSPGYLTLVISASGRLGHPGLQRPGSSSTSHSRAVLDPRCRQLLPTVEDVEPDAIRPNVDM